MLNDLRYALRTLLKSPGFTTVAVATLALGIGANSAIFSVVNNLLFHSLPYPHAERLVRVQEKTAGFGQMDISYPNFLDWAAQNKVFESQAVVRPESFTLMDAGEPERLKGVKVSSGMFATLGVHPGRGRGFLSGDDRKGAAPTVILSDGLWKRRFGGDSSVIGRTVRLDGIGYTVVGVMPPGFNLPLIESDLLVPLGLDADMRRGNRYLVAVARLNSGVTVAQAGNVRMLVVRQAFGLVTIGVAAGLAASLAVTRLMSSVLFGVSASDPTVLAGTTALLAAVALAASYFPARRATRVDPVVTLRYE